jgi:hypothetical protein
MLKPWPIGTNILTENVSNYAEVRPFSFCYLTEVGGHCISTTETPEEFSLI